MLVSYENQFGNYSFLDVHKAGNNNFTDTEYGDFDHLNKKGSTKLSLLLADTMRKGKDGFAENDSSKQNIEPEEKTQKHENIQFSSKPKQSEIVKNDNTKAELPSSDNDIAPPVIESHLGELDYMVGSFPPDNRPLIWAEYNDDGSGIDTSNIKMFMDEQDITTLCDITTEKISFKPANTLDAPKLYKFTVIVSDQAGNKTQLDWEILLKRC
jgi:hypothetical protein